MKVPSPEIKLTYVKVESTFARAKISYVRDDIPPSETMWVPPQKIVIGIDDIYSGDTCLIRIMSSFLPKRGEGVQAFGLRLSRTQDVESTRTNVSVRVGPSR